MTFLNKNCKIVIIILTLLCMTIGLAIWISAEDPITYISPTTGYISPSDISINGNEAFVSDATSNKVYKLDLGNNEVIAEYNTNQPVHSIFADNENVYILEGGLAGNLIKLGKDLSSAEKTAETGHTPTDMVILNDKIYVACRYSNQIYVYNQSSMELITKIDVPREPMALTIEGSNIYVACHLNDGAANAEKVSAKVAVIDTASDSVSKEIPLLNGSGGVKDICTSTDGKFVYVSNIIARYNYPTSQLDRGWINTNAVTIIDTSKQEVLTAVLLDNVEEGAGNPWGIECVDNTLIVAISGTNEIITIDTEKMLQKIENVSEGRISKVSSVDRIPDYIPFLDDFKTRIIVGTNIGTENESISAGVRNFAVSDGKAYICGYFTGDVSIYNISENKISNKISLGVQPEEDSIRKGERLWNDANNCYQKWESCASCHPDARVDALNWDNLNDGLGNPKNVKSMLYSHRTPPVMTTAIRESAEIAVRAGVKFIQFNTMDDEMFNALDDYLKSLSPIQSPYLNRDGSLTDDALEGKKLFESQGCIQCHYGPNFTDMQKHKSSSPTKDSWEYRDFDTPTLIETWATGPWFASGQFSNLRDAVKVSIRDGSKLSDKQIDQLTAYVGSIGNQDQYYGVVQVNMESKDGSKIYNILEAGGKFYEMTIKKQLETDKRAEVVITFYNKDKSKIDSKTFGLNDMKVGDVAKIPLDITMPEDLEYGAYFTVVIFNGSAPLATDFTVYNLD